MKQISFFLLIRSAYIFLKEHQHQQYFCDKNIPSSSLIGIDLTPTAHWLDICTTWCGWVVKCVLESWWLKRCENCFCFDQKPSAEDSSPDNAVRSLVSEQQLRPAMPAVVSSTLLEVLHIFLSSFLFIFLLLFFFLGGLIFSIC